MLKNIKISLHELFNIEISQDETFYIYNGILTRLQNKASAVEVNIEEIKELEVVMNTNCNLDEKNYFLKEFRNIKEKCNVHNNRSCNEYIYKNEHLCIMKLFTVFGFRPSPHQNSEFGDVNFQVTYESEKRRLVGIAKSRRESETLTVSSKEGRELIQQVITMSHDVRADIIAVICPMRFHPQLENEIVYIGRITGKKIVYFDDEFMVRLLKYYRNNTILNASDN